MAIPTLIRGRRWATVALVCLTGGGCGQHSYFASACGGIDPLGVVVVERSHEDSFSRGLALRYTFPEGRQTSRTVLQATTQGKMWRLQRYEQMAPEFCLVGDILLQRGWSSIDVMTQTGSFALEIENGESGGTFVEVEAGGGGVHVSSEMLWYWDDIPGALRPEAEQAVERWFRANEHRRADVWPEFVGTLMQVQWGSDTRLTYGRIFIDAFLQSSNGVSGDSVPLIYADFELLDDDTGE